MKKYGAMDLYVHVSFISCTSLRPGIPPVTYWIGRWLDPSAGIGDADLTGTSTPL
jgi:hypothetical protein